MVGKLLRWRETITVRFWCNAVNFLSFWISDNIPPSNPFGGGASYLIRFFERYCGNFPYNTFQNFSCARLTDFKIVGHPFNLTLVQKNFTTLHNFYYRRVPKQLALHIPSSDTKIFSWYYITM